jgi:hypothetical protein
MKRSWVTIAALILTTLSQPLAAQVPDAVIRQFCQPARFPLACRVCVRAAVAVVPEGQPVLLNSVAFFCLGVTSLFDAEATLSPNGRTVTATGTFRPCAPNEKVVQISAAIVQDSIPTSAQGDSAHRCAPQGQRTPFRVLAAVPPGKPAFFEGEPVEACAVASTRGVGGRILDIKHWCSFPTLVTE